jgi:hypothetical protein
MSFTAFAEAECGLAERSDTLPQISPVYTVPMTFEDIPLLMATCFLNHNREHDLTDRARPRAVHPLIFFTVQAPAKLVDYSVSFP